MDRSKLEELTFDKVLACKRISVDPKEVKSVISRAFEYVDYFNSLPEDAYTVFDRPLSEIRVINEFSYYVKPNRVSLDPSDRRWNNLLLKADKIKEGKGYNINEWNNIQIKFRGYFKKSVTEDARTLAELRGNFSISEILSKASVNGMVNYSGQPFIPIQLDNSLAELQNKGVPYFSIDENLVISDFIANLIF